MQADNFPYFTYLTKESSSSKNAFIINPFSYKGRQMADTLAK